jgi:hypothetical protein
MCKLFSDQESADHGVYHFKFDKEDIVRSEFVKFVVGKIEDGSPHSHEMFPGN